MLWVAEGFLKPSRSESLEELAYSYLEDLVKKNLVIVSRRKSNDRIRTCRIHDLLRDLCVRTAQGEKFLHLMDNYPEFSREGIMNPRRLTICSDHFINNLGDLHRPSIRTALYLRCPEDIQLRPERFLLLRVLDTLTILFAKFPCQICQLLYLRYLAFSHNNIEKFKLPSSISKLLGLQILVIGPSFKSYTSGSSTLYLPQKIWKMLQLRHLVFLQRTGFPLPSSSDGKIAVLENLQTLSQVVNLKFTKQDVKMIPNIKKIRILYSHDRDRSYPKSRDYFLENLEHLHQMETLILESVILYSFPFWKNMKLPESLRKLELILTHIPWSEMSRAAGSLPNLEVLKLKEDACDGYVWETNEGEFPKLKVLEINDSWPYTWNTEDSSHFPSLERLCIFNCYHRMDLPECIGEIETLQLMEVTAESKLLVKWAKDLQMEQLNLLGTEIGKLINLTPNSTPSH